MESKGFKRKLTAILNADVVGYSRLMRADEEATVHTLNTYREIIFDLIDRNRGRLVDSTGDNLLAEFTSVVDAVRCAVQIQKDLKSKNEELPDNRKMEFRIGINTGDVIQEGDRIYGDGVNTAARIESLSDAGGICISRTAYDQVKRKLNLKYEYLGEYQVKNIDEPVRVYKVLVWSGQDELPEEDSSLEPASAGRMAYPLPDKPSIAVLPFTNMSGDPTQDYIGDGLSENITSALSISSRLFVIARNSTFTYKGKPVKVQQVAEDLGVQYVLEGSVQKSGDRLRVTAQFIDALTGHHLWSEKYDRKMKDLFDLQDEITKKILISLHVELTLGEDTRVFAKSTEDLEAWKYLLKATDYFLKYNKEDNVKSREQAKAALEVDPDYVAAVSHLAATHYLDVILGWSDNPGISIKHASELAQKALEMDDQDEFAQAMVGQLSLLQGQYEKSITELKRSITLNPNYPIGHAFLSLAMYLSGRFDEAITLHKKAYRLNPKLPPIWLTWLCGSYIFLGRYEEALETCNQMEDHVRSDDIPGWVPPYMFAWVYQELGREEEARIYMANALRVNPDLSLEDLKFREKFKNPAYLQRELDAYRKAGLPEKPRQAVQEKPSIAVLPFVNMSNDPEQEYFSDGMSEEIIGALAKLEGLKVISRTSAFHFKGKDTDLRTIGEKLKVEHVLEGSVRKAGNKLRISAQLIKVDDDTHLWAESFNRELIDVFDIQEEISQAVVENLKVVLLKKSDEPLVKEYTKNMEAYELFLKGLFFQSKGYSGLEKAVESFEKAIKAGSEYAPAYSNLAATYFSYAAAFSPPSKEIWSKIKSLVQKALEIDEMDAIAHTSMGTFKAFSDYHWQGAEKDFKRAIVLNPGNSFVHSRYANYLIGMGRVYEAIEKMKHALELDPLSIYFHFGLIVSFYMARQFDKAIAQSQKTFELAPNNPSLLAGLALSYAAKGMYDEGIAMIYQVRDIPLVTAFLGYIYGKAGKRKEAQEILKDFLNKTKHGHFSPFLIATVYSGLGDMDKVFEWMEIAFEERDINLWPIKVDPVFDDAHLDPRWTKLMEKMGLAE